MEQENTSPTMQPEQTGNAFNQVTPLSKYLAMILFIAMPFMGGWVGYHYVSKCEPTEIIRYVQGDVKQEYKQSFSRSEIEDLYYNEYGAIKLVKLPMDQTPLYLTGTIETAEREDEDNKVLIRLSDDSYILLPSEVKQLIGGEEEQRKIVTLAFNKQHPVLRNIKLQNGGSIRIGITEYYRDTRRIETYDSAALISAEILN